MRWEIYFNDKTRTVTVIDAPEGYEFTPPESVGASIGNMVDDSKPPLIIYKGSTVLKTWLTQRFAFLGIEDPIENIQHLPQL